MESPFCRTGLIYGAEGLRALAASRVAVFGVGGVGGYVVEALARSGIGALELIDADTISVSNLNRQIIATRATLGRSKVEAARERVLSIHPECQVVCHQLFYGPDTAERFDFSRYDYVVDAIDTVTGKIALVEQAFAAHTPIICAMGAGNKVDPSAFRVADLSKTTMDPLARVMRKELGKRGIRHVKVVFSTEPPLTPRTEEIDVDQNPASRRSVPGSSAFVPAAAGLVIAAEVVRDLTGFGTDREEG